MNNTTYPLVLKMLTPSDLVTALTQFQQDIESALERIRPLIKDEVGYSKELAQNYQVQSQGALTDADVELKTSSIEHGLPTVYKQLLELVGPFQIDPFFNRLSLYDPANRLESIGSRLEREGISKELNNFEHGHYHKYLIFAEIGCEVCIGEHDAWEALAFNRERPNDIVTVSYGDYYMGHPDNNRVRVDEKGQQLVLDFFISKIQRIHEYGITQLEEVEQEYSSDQEWDYEVSENLESELPKGTDLHEFCIRWFNAIKEGEAQAYKNLIANHDDLQEKIERSSYDEKTKQRSLTKLKAYTLKFEERLANQFQIAHSVLTPGKKENVILTNITINEFEQRGILFHRAMLHFSDIDNSEANNEFEIKLTDLAQTSQGWRLFGSVNINR